MPSSSLLEDLESQQIDGFLSYDIHHNLKEKYGISYYELEKIALENDIIPLKYKRNANSIKPNEQLKLLTSKVAIIGCGGLGGNISEYLARIGIGNILLMDFDKFDEHNLNRQNYSTVESLGRYKVDVAKESISKINPSVRVFTCKEKFDGDFEPLKEYEIIVDALDSPKTKLLLAKKAKQYSKTFVHGAIGGFSIQTATNSTLQTIYRDVTGGAETTLGNLPFVASFCASLQASEVVKSILGKGELFEDGIFFADLLDNEFFIV